MSIKIGNTDINKIYLGNIEIKKVYLGSDVIYESEPVDLVYFEFTVDTRNTGTSNDNQFQLPLVFTALTPNITVDWGDGTTSSVTAWDDPNKLHTYSAEGEYAIKIYGDLKSWAFRNEIDDDKFLQVKKWGQFKFDTDQTFYGASVMTSSAEDIPELSSSMYGAFRSCRFNAPINTWDWSPSTNWLEIFRGNKYFNQSFTGVDSSNVTSFSRAFYGTGPVFNQSLGDLNIGSVVSMTGLFEVAPGVDSVNYSDTLIKWAAQSVQPNLTVDFGASQYTSEGKIARDVLTNTHGWTISDGGLVGVDSKTTRSSLDTQADFDEWTARFATYTSNFGGAAILPSPSTSTARIYQSYKGVVGVDYLYKANIVENVGSSSFRVYNGGSFEGMPIPTSGIGRTGKIITWTGTNTISYFDNSTKSSTLTVKNCELIEIVNGVNLIQSGDYSIVNGTDIFVTENGFSASSDGAGDNTRPKLRYLDLPKQRSYKLSINSITLNSGTIPNLTLIIGNNSVVLDNQPLLEQDYYFQSITNINEICLNGNDPFDVDVDASLEIVDMFSDGIEQLFNPSFSLPLSISNGWYSADGGVSIDTVSQELVYQFSSGSLYRAYATNGTNLNFLEKGVNYKFEFEITKLNSDKRIYFYHGGTSYHNTGIEWKVGLNEYIFTSSTANQLFTIRPVSMSSGDELRIKNPSLTKLTI